jgi:outer membrane protein
MRSIIRGGLVIAACTWLAVPASAQGVLKIAYVNPQALFEAAPGRTTAEATLDREGQGMRAELDRLSTALNQAIADYNRVEPTLTAAQKETRQRTLQAKEDSLRQRQQVLQQQFQQRQSELMAPIMETVKKVLEDIRVEDGYSMILNNDPNTSIIVAADRNLDITERVVGRLRTVAATTSSANRSAPATTPPTTQPAAGAPASTPAGVTRPKPPTV